MQSTRKVWAAASEMHHISIRAIMKQTGISSTAVVAYQLEKLVDAGYMTRGSHYLGGTWRVVVPLGTM